MQMDRVYSYACQPKGSGSPIRQAQGSGGRATLNTKFDGKRIRKEKNRIKPLLGSEVVIADLINKSKLTINYTNLTGVKELGKLLNDLMESGVLATTLAEYNKQQY